MRIGYLGLGALGVLLNKATLTLGQECTVGADGESSCTPPSGENSTLAEQEDPFLDYAYPPRNPEDETTRLLATNGDYLGEISHWLFEGQEDFQKGFRVLIAGGGSGDATIYLAEQLKSTNAEIVYLDSSKKGMEVAQARAKIRGLENIVWVEGSIMNIPDLNIGKFDYIQCSGVLHFLDSPDAGFKVLADALTAKGGMSISVYGQYGRAGVHQYQTLMGYVNKGVESSQERVQNCWEVYHALPSTNWFKLGEDMIHDHKLYGDYGMHHMLLKKPDEISYNISGIYEFVDKAGLNFVEFLEANTRATLTIEDYFQDPESELLEKLQDMTTMKKQSICEIVAGNITDHNFYVSKKKNPVAKLTNLDNVPYMYRPENGAKLVSDYLSKDQPELIGSTVAVDLGNDLSVKIPISNYTLDLFRNIVDGNQSLKEISKAIKKDMGKNFKDADLVAEFNTVLGILEKAGVLLLRNKKVDLPPLPSS